MNENENPNVSADPAGAPVGPAPQEAPYVQPAYEPAPQKKAFPKIILMICALVVVGAAAFFGIRSLAGGGTPLTRAIAGAQKTVQALEKNDFAATAKNVSSTGSVSVSVDVSKLADLVGAEIPAKIDFTAYTNQKDGKAAFTVDGQIKNKSILNGTFLCSEEQIAVACEAILGKTNYSLDLKNLAKNLKGSLLDPDSDSDFALPEEVFNWLTGLKNGPIAPMKEMAKDMESLSKAAVKVIKDSAEKNADITKENETVSIGETDVKTTAVTVKLNGKQAAAIVGDLLKWAKGNKDIKNLMTKFADTYGPVFDAEGIDADDMIEDFYDEIDDMLEELDEAEKEDLNLTAVFYLAKSGGQLVKLEITSKDDYGKTTYTFEGGPDWKKPTYVAFTQKDNWGKTSVTYTVEEDTKSQFTAKIKVKEDNDTNMSLTISWDKSTGELRISSSEMDLKITGTLNQKGKVTTIELKKFEYDGMAIKDLGTTITLNESAKMPTISKTTEVLKLKEEDLEDLAEDVQEAVEQLMEKIQDAAE